MSTNFSSEKYIPKFSGHETFPLRFGWLKKCFDALQETNPNPFKDESAIARFGVGKNMVTSMQYWAEATGVIETDRIVTTEGKRESVVRATEFGSAILHDDGYDPYLEDPSSIWLLHWNLISAAQLTTWHWSFNYFNSPEFDREQILRSLVQLASNRGWANRAAFATLKRDIECLTRSYCAKDTENHESLESALESPFVELNLIIPTGKRDGFRFNIGDKTNLTSEVVCFAVMDYWREIIVTSDNELKGAMSTSLSAEKVIFEPGSPGKTFLLNEDIMTTHLEQLEKITDGLLQFSDDSGIKQIRRKSEIKEKNIRAVLEKIYSSEPLGSEIKDAS